MLYVYCLFQIPAVSFFHEYILVFKRLWPRYTSIDWSQNTGHRICSRPLKQWCHMLKLYCRYEYIRPYMINRIWSLKQLWLQVNGHAWFHLHGLRWPVRNGEGVKNSKRKYMFPAGFEPTPRPSMTGKSAP